MGVGVHEREEALLLRAGQQAARGHGRAASGARQAPQEEASRGEGRLDLGPRRQHPPILGDRAGTRNVGKGAFSGYCPRSPTCHRPGSRGAAALAVLPLARGSARAAQCPAEASTTVTRSDDGAKLVMRGCWCTAVAAGAGAWRPRPAPGEPAAARRRRRRRPRRRRPAAAPVEPAGPPSPEVAGRGAGHPRHRPPPRAHLARGDRRAAGPQGPLRGRARRPLLVRRRVGAPGPGRGARRARPRGRPGARPRGLRRRGPRREVGGRCAPAPRPLPPTARSSTWRSPSRRCASSSRSTGAASTRASSASTTT